MSPAVYYPVEQTSLSDNLLSTLVSPTRTRVQPVRQNRDKVGYKTNPVECAVADHTYWREASESGKPVRGGTGIDTLLRVPSC